MCWFWSTFVWFRRRFKWDLRLNRWCEYRGYRRAVGGRWGLWETDLQGLVRLWLPSACEHYPPPPLATHTEPLLVEDHGG